MPLSFVNDSNGVPMLTGGSPTGAAGVALEARAAILSTVVGDLSALSAVAVVRNATTGNVTISGAGDSSLYHTVILNSTVGRQTSFQLAQSGAGKWGVGIDYAANGSNNLYIYDVASGKPRLFADSATGQVRIGGHAYNAGTLHINDDGTSTFAGRVYIRNSNTSFDSDGASMYWTVSSFHYFVIGATYQGVLDSNGLSINNGSIGPGSGVGFRLGSGRMVLPGSTSESSLTAGSFELQGYAVNNCWLGDNVVYNGSNFVLRSAGYGVLSYYYNGGYEVRVCGAGSAGGTVTPTRPFRVNNDGSVAIGGDLSGTTDPTYIGSHLYVAADGTRVNSGYLAVEQGDISVNNIGSGLCLRSPDGSFWRLKVNDSGVLSTEYVP